MVQHRSELAQARTGIHGGVGRGAAAAAIGAVLVLATGAPAAQGTLIPAPTIPVTPPGGLIDPPGGTPQPSGTAPATAPPAANETGAAATAPPAPPANGTATGAAVPPVAPAVPPAAAPEAPSSARSAAAVGRSTGGPASPARRSAEAAAQAAALDGKGSPGSVPARSSVVAQDGVAGRLPDQVLAGFGLGLLAVAAAAGVLFARLRGA